MSDCCELDGLTTAYVDGEGTPAERRIVEVHLETCPPCREAAAAEAEARRLLRVHAPGLRLARGTVGTRRWRYGLAAASAALTPARLGTAALLGLVVLLGINRPNVVEAIGVIGDSACGANPHYDHSSPAAARQCTLNCVAHGAQFVFISQDVVYRIANQTFPALPSLANARVAVTGVLEDGALIVARVEPAMP